MKILFLGKNGFIAKNFIEFFSDRDGYQVISVGRNELNLLNESEVRDYLSNNTFDVVINPAVFNPVLAGHPDKELEYDLMMFHNVAKFSKLYGKMIYFGSGAEYDKRSSICSVTEDDIYNAKSGRSSGLSPTNQYGIAKYTIGREIDGDTFGEGNIYNLRIFGLFGKYEYWKTTFISSSCCKALKNIPITIRKNVFFDYLYIDDFMRMLEKFLNIHEPMYNTYNFTSGRRVQLTGLAEIVGTGGDGKGSFNISSMSALVASSCGQVMAKHGNRAVSSKSGAADFFEALGINIMASPEKTAQLVRKTGFGFLMAPVYHSAMRFAAPIRKALGIKTIFNVLGPLLNPANAEYEVLGVYSKELLRDYARAAKSLGAKRVMVVNSEDGYDEISPCAPTSVYQIDEKGNENQYVINPANFGIADADENELYGGNGSDNAKLAMEVLNGGGRKTIRYAVGLNAGAVLYLCGKARTLKDGYAMALEAIDSGKTLAKLKEIQRVSEELSA